MSCSKMSKVQPQNLINNERFWNYSTYSVVWLKEINLCKEEKLNYISEDEYWKKQVKAKK